MNNSEILKNLKNEIIVSIQAMENEPLYDENCILALSKSVITLGGAKAVRLAGERDIRNIKKHANSVLFKYIYHI